VGAWEREAESESGDSLERSGRGKCDNGPATPRRLGADLAIQTPSQSCFCEPKTRDASSGAQKGRWFRGSGARAADWPAPLHLTPEWSPDLARKLRSPAV
jgi:hypothetical protein